MSKETSGELDIENVTDSCRESSKLLLSEEQAIAKARNHPNDALPILISYSQDDHDNPRNWPKWRKWYITIVVSMLNVFTYAPHPLARLERELNLNTGLGVQEVSPRVPQEFKKNLVFQLKSLL